MTWHPGPTWRYGRASQELSTREYGHVDCVTREQLRNYATHAEIGAVRAEISARRDEVDLLRSVILDLLRVLWRSMRRSERGQLDRLAARLGVRR